MHFNLLICSLFVKLSRLPQASRTGDRIPFQRPPLRAILYNLNIFFFFFPVGIILKLIFILHMLNSCVHVLNMSTLQRLEFKTHYAIKKKMGNSPLVSWVTEEKRQNMFFTKYCICGLWRTVNLPNSTVVLEATFCQESSKDKYKSIKYKVLHCNNQHFI